MNATNPRKTACRRARHSGCFAVSASSSAVRARRSSAPCARSGRRSRLRALARRHPACKVRACVPRSWGQQATGEVQTLPKRRPGRAASGVGHEKSAVSRAAPTKYSEPVMTISPSSGVVSRALAIASAAVSTTSMCSAGKPESTAASAITAGSAPGFGGRAHTSCATSSRPSAVSISSGSRSRSSPITSVRPRARTPRPARAVTPGAGNVVRAVEQHERMAADDLQPARANARA